MKKSALLATTATPLILAIDTSCDDTSAAVTCGFTYLSNVVASQTQLHKQYGGVFPTVAKQAHRENIDPTVRAALKKAGVQLSDLDAIAVTQGPGLAPALEVGIEKAKKLAVELGVPLIPVNHIEGHALSALVGPVSKNAEHSSQPRDFEFPLLSIVVSGKHSDFILIKKFGEYERLGFTLDDAAGEALDKFGRMVDLGYPAGPAIEEFAHRGDAHKYAFPLPMTTSGDFNLSFSGLKTSARNLTEQLKADAPLSQQQVFDLCASFQYATFHAITYKLSKLLKEQQLFGVLLGGGVAANMELRRMIRETIKPYGLTLQTPYNKRLCVDNGAMIGAVAGLKFERDEVVRSEAEIAKVERVPRWHVDEN
jgi:N6-L-threonylcarbamoyladenine synthase